MITDLFNRCIAVVLMNEGGYVNNIYDSGGETNFGIAKRFYPSLDIKNLTMNDAIQIYFRDYWSKMNLIGIKDENLILQIFDMGVNAGIRTAIKIIQKIVNIKQDGIIGPKTLSLINDSENIVEQYKQERKNYYISLAKRKPELQIFLAGWLNRIERTKFA